MRLSAAVESAVRLSIRHKLFLALFAATTLVVAVMYAFMHWSFQHGFVSFLENRQQAYAERLAGQLAEVYAADGNWDGILGDRVRWWRLMADARGMHAPGMGMGPGHRMGGGMGGGPRGLDGGLALLDADKHVLAGRAADAGDLALTPVRVDDRVVGYVGRVAGRPLSELVDVRFADAQRRAFLVIAVLVGALAVALAWPLANTLVRPLRRVTAATRALAAGHYDTRVPVRSSDELGDLGRDFNDLAQALERTESARRDWMADISHELRTPISLLKAELEAMQDGVRAMTPTALAGLQADVDRLGRVVEDLYQLSMTDLGAMSYHKRPVDPLALLEDDAEALAGEFERKGLGLAVRAELAQPVTLHADPDRLSQLFRNLMQNSLRYTDAGGRLEIVAGVAGGRLRLDFDDSPPGVPEAALGRLFERFYRVEGSRNRAHGGAGLGLAICRNIVEAHGGLIEARPSRLGGLGIRVELPLAP